jgi:hypothetical protein
MALDTEQLQIFGWNKKAHKYMKNGLLVQVMQALFQQTMTLRNRSPDNFTFFQVIITACTSLGALEDHRRHVHEQ